LGKLNVIPNGTNFELSRFHNQYFLYWGPAPVLFVIPFYLIFGLATSDVLYTLVAGLLNVIIFYLLIQEFIKYFRLTVRLSDTLFVFLSFAFASPNIFLSVVGKIWPTSQIVSILYLLIFYLFYFKFLNNVKSIKYFIISIIFLNLAWLSRASLVVDFVSLAYVFFIVYHKNKEYFKKLFLYAVGISIIFVILFLGYNYLRFGNMLNTGLEYQKGNPRYEPILTKSKFFSLSNISYNFNYQFLNFASMTLPTKDNIVPNVKFDPEGNSAVSVYPFMLLSLFLLQAKFLKDKKIQKFLLTAFSVIGLNIGLLLLYFSTGATQFGSRFFLDVIPLLFLITIFAMKDIPKVFKYSILIYGFMINVLGTIIFHSLIW